jgi:hypothetical protein
VKERDYRILEALEKWGALGLGQIDGAFFRNTAEWSERMRLLFNNIDRRDYWQVAYKRMDTLRKAGFVRLERYINHHQVYLLTSSGHRLLASLGRSVLRGIRPTLPEFFLDHELAVAGVGLLLEERLGRRVLSNRQLYAVNYRKRRRGEPAPIYPDIWVVAPRPCVVEIELSLKSPRRYEALFDQYRRRLPSGARLLYLTGSRIKNTIFNHGREQRMPFLYAAALEDFRAGWERCVFEGTVRDATFQFAELTAAVEADRTGRGNGEEVAENPRAGSLP